MYYKSVGMLPSWVTLLVVGIGFSSCTNQEDIIIDFPSDDTPIDSQTILEIFQSNYTQMPEEAITISQDSTVWAQYASPTNRYAHGILGDRIEAGQLVVAANGQILDVTLDSLYVYEDVRPRLYDVDGDGELEVIAIRSHLDLSLIHI